MMLERDFRALGAVLLISAPISMLERFRGGAVVTAAAAVVGGDGVGVFADTGGLGVVVFVTAAVDVGRSEDLRVASDFRGGEERSLWED